MWAVTLAKITLYFLSLRLGITSIFMLMAFRKYLLHLFS